MTNCKFCAKELTTSEEGGELCHGCWEMDKQFLMLSSETVKRIAEAHGYSLLDNGQFHSTQRGP